MARFRLVRSVASDEAGNLFLADEIDPSARPCPTQPCEGAPGDGGPATEAKLGTPTGIAIASSGRLYVFDSGDNRVRLVNLGTRSLRAHGVTVEPGAIETVAGRGREPGGDDVPEGGPARHARLGVQPAMSADIAADDAGNLFIGDGNRVRQVDADGRITTLVSNDGPDRARCCKRATGLVVDASGNLYVSDWSLARVWFLNRGSEPVTVHGHTVAPGATQLIAGTYGTQSGGDGGPALEPQLDNPLGMAVDGQGNLYIAQGIWAQDHTVRMVDARGIISTVVGAGSQGFNGDGLAPGRTTLTRPADVALDACGNLLISDEGNDRVRRVRASECQAAPARQGAGGVGWPVVALGLAAAVVAADLLRRRSGRRRRPAPTPPSEDGGGQDLEPQSGAVEAVTRPPPG